MRTSIVAGNWKMNGSLAANAELIAGILKGVSEYDGIEVLVCPPALYTAQVSGLLEGSRVASGAQNASAFESGAYTGEVSLGMLKEFGVRHVIVGHSERRALFAESDEQVAQKAQAICAAGMVPIVCVGETLEEREAGRTVEVVSRQLQTAIDSIPGDALAQVVVAYEPVWAIGTGKTATPEQAQEVHAALRELVAGVDAEVANRMRILYGGSVNAANAAQLFAKPDIDGGLVGGASLKANEFIAICGAAAGAKVTG